MLMMLWYMFENHVIYLLLNRKRTRVYKFEYHAILSSSKLTYFFKQLYELFEYHVILSSAKPTRFTSCRQCWFEYHVISSSSKPPADCYTWACVWVPCNFILCQTYTVHELRAMLVWVPCNFIFSQTCTFVIFKGLSHCNFFLFQTVQRRGFGMVVVWVPCNFIFFQTQHWSLKSSDFTKRLSTM